jgi:hypothetical protein
MFGPIAKVSQGNVILKNELGADWQRNQIKEK